MQKLTTTLLATIILTLSIPTSHSQQPDLNLKNVTLFISDGCGQNQIETASYYQHGKPDGFAFHKFPLSIYMSTYQINNSYDAAKAWESLEYLNKKPTDSAASATALASGKITYNGAIGYIGEKGKNAQSTDCATDFAKQNGKATGVVSSVEFAHATPAAFVAHNKSRGNYEQIAREMLTQSNVDLIMGCGHPEYDSSGKKMDQPNYKFGGGQQTWEKLKQGKLEAPDCNGDGTPDTWTFIQTREQFQQLAKSKTPPTRVCGVPQVHETLQAKRTKQNVQTPYADPFNENIPTLKEMTEAAINVLSQDKDGFLLMVEGGAIDWAGHANELGRCIEEETDFAAAVAAATAWVEANSSWQETLIIVTADHETGFLVGPNATGTIEQQFKLQPSKKGEIPKVHWLSKKHTNQLVPLFANGPKAALDKLQKLASQQDPKRGPYLHNSAIGNLIIDCVQKNKRSQ